MSTDDDGDYSMYYRHYDQHVPEMVAPKLKMKPAALKAGFDLSGVDKLDSELAAAYHEAGHAVATAGSTLRHHPATSSCRPFRKGEAAAATMPDLVAGKQYHAEVMILKQDYSNDPAAVAAGHDGTEPNAWVEFKFNDSVLRVHASNIQPVNEFVKFDLVFDGVAGESISPSCRTAPMAIRKG